MYCVIISFICPNKQEDQHAVLVKQAPFPTAQVTENLDIPFSKADYLIFGSNVLVCLYVFLHMHVRLRRCACACDQEGALAHVNVNIWSCVPPSLNILLNMKTLKPVLSWEIRMINSSYVCFRTDVLMTQGWRHAIYVFQALSKKHRAHTLVLNVTVIHTIPRLRLFLSMIAENVPACHLQETKQVNSV